jgi:nitrogenase molybdenum-iron protein alpha/beta subunit
MSWFSGIFGGPSKIENNQFNTPSKVEKKLQRLTIISGDKSDPAAQQIAKALLYMEQKLYKSIVSSPKLSNQEKVELLTSAKNDVYHAIKFAKDDIQIELDRFNIGLFSHYKSLIKSLKSKPAPVLSNAQIINSMGRLSKMMSNVSVSKGTSMVRKGESMASAMPFSAAPGVSNVSNAEVNEVMKRAAMASALRLTSKAPNVPFGKASYGGKHKTRRNKRRCSRRQKY